MKFAASALMAVAMAGTLVSGAVVEPTPAARLEARQDPAQFSALLQNPSSALAYISSLITVPAVSSAFRSAVQNPTIISQVSAQLVSQYGSASGGAAFSSYEAVVGSLLGETQARPTSTASVSGSGSSGNSGATGGTSATSSGTNGAGLLSVGAMGAAVVAGAAVVVAAL